MMVPNPRKLTNAVRVPINKPIAKASRIDIRNIMISIQHFFSFLKHLIHTCGSIVNTSYFNTRLFY